MVVKGLDKKIFWEIKNIIHSHNNDESELIAILLETQAIIPGQYIPKEAAQFIARELGIRLNRIYGVITFYAALSEKPRGHYLIQICNSTVCRVRKNETLKETMERHLEIKVGETTADGVFTLMTTHCFGACDIAPAIRIGENVYGNLTEEKIEEILDFYKEEAVCVNQ